MRVAEAGAAIAPAAAPAVAIRPPRMPVEIMVTAVR
jgi:hypothetical protein